MTEQWKELPGFEGFYEVSNLGALRSLSHAAKGSYNTVRSFPGQLMTLSTYKASGYKYVNVSKEGKRSKVKMHRAVLLAFSGPCPPRREARHLNGARADNRFENLCWGTKAQNYNDRRSHGTETAWEKNGRARLNNETVRKIKLSLSEGMSHAQAARLFNANKVAISHIACGRTWVGV